MSPSCELYILINRYTASSPKTPSEVSILSPITDMIHGISIASPPATALDSADFNMDFGEDLIQASAVMAHTKVDSGITGPGTKATITHEQLQDVSPVKSSHQQHLRGSKGNPITIESQDEVSPTGSKGNPITIRPHSEESPDSTEYNPFNINTPQTIYGPNKHSPDSQRLSLDLAEVVEGYQSNSHATGSNSLGLEAPEKSLSIGKSPRARFIDNSKWISTGIPTPRMLQSPSGSYDEVFSTLSEDSSSGSGSPTPEPVASTDLHSAQSSVSIPHHRGHLEPSASILVSEITPAIS